MLASQGSLVLLDADLVARHHAVCGDGSAGGFDHHFAGHNILEAAVAMLGRTAPSLSPDAVLVSGSSAGGIGALLHADWFAATWPRATVKTSAAGGFFYAGVSSRSDFEAGRATPTARLGFATASAPWAPPACLAATAGDVVGCTDAHVAVKYLRAPLFVAENQCADACDAGEMGARDGPRGARRGTWTHRMPSATGTTLPSSRTAALRRVSTSRSPAAAGATSASGARGSASSCARWERPRGMASSRPRASRTRPTCASRAHRSSAV